MIPSILRCRFNFLIELLSPDALAYLLQFIFRSKSNRHVGFTRSIQDWQIKSIKREGEKSIKKEKERKIYQKRERGKERNLSRESFESSEIKINNKIHQNISVWCCSVRWMMRDVYVVICFIEILPLFLFRMHFHDCCD